DLRRERRPPSRRGQAPARLDSARRAPPRAVRGVPWPRALPYGVNVCLRDLLRRWTSAHAFQHPGPLYGVAHLLVNPASAVVALEHVECEPRITGFLRPSLGGLQQRTSDAVSLAGTRDDRVDHVSDGDVQEVVPVRTQRDEPNRLSGRVLGGEDRGARRGVCK